MDPTRPGIQTTEFWVTAITVVAQLLIAGGIIKVANQPLIQALAVVLATVVPAVYVWGRSRLKMSVAEGRAPPR